MSKIKSALLALAVASLLAGCASAATPTLQAFEGITPACASFKGGKEIDDVKVTAEKATVPTVSFVTNPVGSATKTPLASIKESQTRIIRQGEGPTFTGNQLIKLEFAVFSSTTGVLLGSSKFDGTDAASQLFDNGNSKIYCDALSGVKEGSLAVFATPSSETDPEGSLFVVEIVKVYLPWANGPVLSPESGFPKVVRDPKTHQPGLMAPSFSAPSEFKRSILIEGRGEKVAIGDSVTVNYVGWVWSEPIGSEFESSWKSGLPATFTLVDDQMIKGFVKALDGVKVGSQVIAILPPADAYGESGTGSIPANSTLIFVIDVLGINK